MAAGFVVHNPALSIRIAKGTVNDEILSPPFNNRRHTQFIAGILLRSQQPSSAHIAQRIGEHGHDALGSGIHFPAIPVHAPRRQLLPDGVAQRLDPRHVPVFQSVLGDMTQPAVYDIPYMAGSLTGPGIFDVASRRTDRVLSLPFYRWWCGRQYPI